MSLEFPANVLLIAAMNPCPCGYHRVGKGEEFSGARPVKVCMCSFDQIQRYRAKISGPLLDRIDMHVLVDAVSYREFFGAGKSESSALVRQRVVHARNLQRTRSGEGALNASMSQSALDKVAPVDESMLSIIEEAIEKNGLSTRAINRLRKVSRTIADLAGESQVNAEHLSEALSFRVLS